MQNYPMVFWGSSAVLLAAAAYDIVRHGINSLNVIVLIALLAMVLLVKLSGRIHRRAVLLVVALIPIVSLRSWPGLQSLSEDFHKTLGMAIFLITMIHCTEAGRKLADGE